MSDLTGLNTNESKKTVAGLNTLLANVFVTYGKTLNFHWNIKGKRFATLHGFLEEQYTFLAETADSIAERIRVYDERAPGSLKEFLDLASIKESIGQTLTADQMLAELSDDYAVLIAHMRHEHEHIPDNDYGTHTLYEDLITHLEKTRWMIKSHLS